MNFKYLPLALSIGACLGLAACSDKTPEADAPAAAATPAATAPAPTADGAVPAAPTATIVTPWTGDLAAATAEPHCALDALNGKVATDGKFTLPTGQPAVIEGWVASSDMRSAPAFSLVLDGATDYQLAGTTSDLRVNGSSHGRAKTTPLACSPNARQRASSARRSSSDTVSALPLPSAVTASV